MGMSGDFEAAIGWGATLVRVGTAIFGPRPGTRSPSDRAGFAKIESVPEGGDMSVFRKALPSTSGSSTPKMTTVYEV